MGGEIGGVIGLILAGVVPVLAIFKVAIIHVRNYFIANIHSQD